MLMTFCGLNIVTIYFTGRSYFGIPVFPHRYTHIHAYKEIANGRRNQLEKNDVEFEMSIGLLLFCFRGAVSTHGTVTWGHEFLSASLSGTANQLLIFVHTYIESRQRAQRPHRGGQQRI